MSISLPEVGAVPCARCGAALVLTALSGHARCATCGSQQALPAELTAQMAAYQQAVAAQVPAIVLRVSSRELWAHRGKTAAARLWGLVIVAVLFLVELIVGFPLALVLNRTGVVPLETSLVWGLGVFGIVVVIAGVVSLITWSGAGRGAAPPQVQLPDVDVACSGCGAPTVMRSGQATAECAHCRAQLVASREKVQHVVRVAERWLRRAVLEQHAARRSVWAPRSNLPLAYRNDHARYERQTEARYAEPAALAQAPWFHAVAAGLGGQVLRGDALIAWLDATWPGPYTDVDYFWAHPRFAVSLVRHDHPALIDHAPAMAPRAPAALVVSIATEPSPAQVRGDEVAALGFTLASSEAGLQARAMPGVAERLLAGPPDVAHLSRVLDALVRAARSAGHAPPDTASPT